MASEHRELIDRLEAWADAEREYGHVCKADDFEDAAKVIRSLEADRAAVAELVEALAGIFAHFDKNGERVQAPGHCHDVLGKWDDTGASCTWCAQWTAARSLLSRHQAGLGKGGDRG